MRNSDCGAKTQYPPQRVAKAIVRASRCRRREVVLSGSPNRLNALLGAATAAGGAGDTDLQEQYRDTVRTQTRLGNLQRTGLAEPM